MSPLSISQYIESGERLFDVVIFDEASQVRPEDAICAILRGTQLIVVGDSKQLPPTSFFSKSLATMENDEDDECADEQPGRTESILNECEGANFLPYMLRWHYRSRHESLIAFSNAHFYDNKLETFPSPHAEHADGVRFEYVADGIYDRSLSRTNRREAERAVELLIEHLQRHPNHTIGVVALSQAQQEDIRTVIERRLRQDTSLSLEIARQLREDDPGGLFVKNLENVQGDERDVIILSVGYGPDAHRKVYTNFGPLNKSRGERRLNVAVTRAREQMIVVSSLRASDLPPTITNPGARILRDYLAYAEQGPSALANQVSAMHQSARSGFDSPFEKAVYDAVTAKGFILDSQVGCSGYYIDLAVRHPSSPGVYLLGIECDGASYHSSKTARDRDRLRQLHLEGLGWHIHRIWSRDWIRNPSREVEKVLEAIKQAQNTPPPASTAESTNASVVVTPVTSTSSVTSSGQAAQPANSVAMSPAKPAAQLSSPTTQQPIRRAGPINTQPPTLSVSTSQAQPRTRTCETCAYFRPLTPSRFSCGKKGTVLARAKDGHTVGCASWVRK